MVSPSFRWVIAPEQQLVPGVQGYERGILQGLGVLADLFAARMEAAARQGARWVDRTGAARQGLRAFAVKEAARVVIYLVHSVFYGIFLELGTRYMAPRPIILPVLEAHYGPLMAAVRKLVGG